MDGFEKLHNTQDEFIKKTLQEDTIVSQDIFDNFSTHMNKTKIKVKKYSYKQQSIISFLLLLLTISVGFNIYLAVVKGTPITITNIFQPAQDYTSRHDDSEFENKISNNEEIIPENIIDNTIENDTSSADSDSNTKNEISNTPVVEEPEPETQKTEPVTPTEDYSEVNNEEIQAFVDQFAIGINKLDLQNSENLESNTILLYIAQQYFSKQSNSSASLSVNTDYASSNTNFHEFLNEFTANDYSNIDYIKSYNNYIGYISRSKAYVYGNDYSILSKEKYKCNSVTIINKENDVYTATANVSRTYINDKKEEEKNDYEITFTFKINNNSKYQRYKLLSLSSNLISGDIETIVHLIGN